MKRLMAPVSLFASAHCWSSTNITLVPLPSGLDTHSRQRMVVLKQPPDTEIWFCCDLSPVE